jgi:hypothetical protein
MPASHLIAEERWSLEVTLVDVDGLHEALLRSFGECHSELAREPRSLGDAEQADERPPELLVKRPEASSLLKLVL